MGSIEFINPIVTKLKNGKNKLEFKFRSEYGPQYNDIILLDELGNFEKRISIEKYPTNGNKKYNLFYQVKTGLEGIDKVGISKKMKSITDENGVRQISLEKAGVWKKNIAIHSNDKLTVVFNNDWQIPGYVYPSKDIATICHKYDGRVVDIRQSITNSDGNKIFYAYQQGQPKRQIYYIDEGVSWEQKEHYRELFTRHDF